jgi:hypothetical protein
VQLPYEGYFQQFARILHPTRFGETSYAVMYGCYLDESFDKAPSGFYAVGGFIAQGVPTFELERGWGKCLERHGLEYFKASECESGRGQFSKFIADPPNITDAERKTLDSISHEFCKIIGLPVPYDPRNFLALFGVGVVQKDFYDVIKNPDARAVLGDNPWRLAYEMAMVQAAWAMKELGEGEPKHCVSFVCDEDEEHAETAPLAYRALKKGSPIAAQYMCTFSPADEKRCAPLQAADAVIYEIRKVLKFSKKDYETKLREQFGLFADSKIMFYVGHTEHVQLEWIAANHKSGEPFKLDELMKIQLGENIDIIRV